MARSLAKLVLMMFVSASLSRLSRWARGWSLQLLLLLATATRLRICYAYCSSSRDPTCEVGVSLVSACACAARLHSLWLGAPRLPALLAVRLPRHCNCSSLLHPSALVHSLPSVDLVSCAVLPGQPLWLHPACAPQCIPRVCSSASLMNTMEVTPRVWPALRVYDGSSPKSKRSSSLSTRSCISFRSSRLRAGSRRCT